MVAFGRIVVAGGGAIGSSIAYYLARDYDMPVTLVDPVGIAPAASGKAGGFLGRDWSDGSVLGPLQRRSFDLHGELAESLGAERIDYRRLTCVEAEVDLAPTSTGGGGRGAHSASLRPSGTGHVGLEWADRNIAASHALGDESTIGQVHPKKLCEALWEFARTKAGSTLEVGRVIGVNVGEGLGVTGVKLEGGKILDAGAVVVACGPWTDEARSWFFSDSDATECHTLAPPLPRMMGIKCPSTLVKSPRVLSEAVFFEGLGDEFEVYPRPDGDVYINGFCDEERVVTERPGNESVPDDAVRFFRGAMDAVSTDLSGREPHTTQSCYMPTTDDGVPVIGRIPGVKGAFVASGHGCWGILNGPATGQAIAELIMDGDAKKVDLRPFSPERFLP